MQQIAPPLLTSISEHHNLLGFHISTILKATQNFFHKSHHCWQVPQNTNVAAYSHGPEMPSKEYQNGSLIRSCMTRSRSLCFQVPVLWPLAGYALNLWGPAASFYFLRPIPRSWRRQWAWFNKILGGLASLGTMWYLCYTALGCSSWTALRETRPIPATSRTRCTQDRLVPHTPCSIMWTWPTIYLPATLNSIKFPITIGPLGHSGKVRGL